MVKRIRTHCELVLAFWMAMLFFAEGPAAQGQPPVLRFEVAVIKPSDPHSTEVWLVPEAHGGFRAQNAVVWQLIKGAYYLRDQQLTGGPAWIKTERYDIVAKAEKTGVAPLLQTADPAQAASFMARHRQRVQALLRDRFGLVLGTEMRVQPHYSLKLAKGGSKMAAAGDGDGNPVARMGTGRLAMTADMKGIAAMLTDIVGRLVVDETGLTGHYNVKLEWTPDTVDGGSIFTAVRDQLGLQLESKKGPVPVFVIERIERPSEN